MERPTFHPHWYHRSNLIRFLPIKNMFSALKKLVGSEPGQLRDKNIPAGLQSMNQSLQRRFAKGVQYNSKFSNIFHLEIVPPPWLSKLNLKTSLWTVYKEEALPFMDRLTYLFCPGHLQGLHHSSENSSMNGLTMPLIRPLEKWCHRWPSYGSTCEGRLTWIRCFLWDVFM